MRTTVEITQQAQHDLEEIASYIRQDNPIAADRLGKQLLNAAQSLEYAPLICYRGIARGHRRFCSSKSP